MDFLDVHEESVTRARFTDDGTRIITSSMDGTVKIYDLRSCKVTLTLSAHTNVVADFHTIDNERRFVSVGWDKRVC